MFMQSLTNAALEEAMSGVWQRRNVIAHNISNEDTPGYKAKRLEFESLLENEIRNVRSNRSLTRAEGIEQLRAVQPYLYEDRSTIGRADENNVDILAEQTELARTELQFEALTQRVSGYYSLLQYAISGGR